MAPPPQREFIERVMKQLGVNQTDLGVLLKKPNAYATVHGWMTRRIKLCYEDTMRMLDLCGWLNMSEAVPSIGEPASVPGDHLAEIATSLRDLLKGQEKILGRVAQVQRRESAVPPEAQPKPKVPRSPRRP